MRNGHAGVAAAVALLVLSGCGSGGGPIPNPPIIQIPSSSSATTGTNTTSTNTTSTNTTSTGTTSTPTTSASALPFQASNTTVTYPVNSASASVSNDTVTGSRIDPAGAGSTITVTTDTSGNVSLVQFNILTPSTNFTNSYTTASITPLASLTLGQLATILSVANVATGANGFVTSTSAGTSTGLASSVYGIWASNDTGTTGRIGVFATGVPTLSGSMPTTGSATYNGSTIGVASSASGGSALTGTVQLVANFATATVGTTISNIQLQNVSSNLVTSQTSLTGSAGIAGNQYTGSLSGGAVSGTSTGTFYGPTANETAGVWRASGGGLTEIGSYGAKR